MKKDPRSFLMWPSFEEPQSSTLYVVRAETKEEGEKLQIAFRFMKRGKACQTFTQLWYPRGLDLVCVCKSNLPFKKP